MKHEFRALLVHTFCRNPPSSGHRPAHNFALVNLNADHQIKPSRSCRKISQIRHPGHIPPAAQKLTIRRVFCNRKTVIRIRYRNTLKNSRTFRREFHSVVKFMFPKMSRVCFFE